MADKSAETKGATVGAKVIMVKKASNGDLIEVSGSDTGEIRVLLCGVHNGIITPLACDAGGKLLTA